MIGSKNLTPTDLDKIEDSLLVEELKKAKEELFNLRFQLATGQLESHGRMRAVRRDIARINTVIRERALGIRAIPVATETPVAKPATKVSSAKGTAEAVGTTEAEPAKATKATKPAASAADDKPAAKPATKSAAKPAAKAAAKPAEKSGAKSAAKPAVKASTKPAAKAAANPAAKKSTKGR